MAISFVESPFEAVSPQLRERIEAVLTRRIFKKGEHLYQDQQAHQGLIWLRSGVALSYRSAEDGRYDMAVPFYRGIWTSPSLFSGVHTISQRAATNCVTDIIYPGEAKRLLEEPEFAQLLSNWCVEDFQLTLDGVASANHTRTEDKIISWAQFIIKCTGSDPHAQQAEQTGTIEWPFSISQIAEFLRLSRPHLSIVLTRLAAEKRLEIKDRQLTVF